MIKAILLAAGQSKRLKSENTVFINCFSKNNIKKGSLLNLKKISFKRDFVKGIQAHEITKFINKKLLKNLKINERIQIKYFK